MSKNRKEFKKAVLVRPLNMQKPLFALQTAADCPEISHFQ